MSIARESQGPTRARNRSGSTVAAFLIGLPVGVAFVVLVHLGVLSHPFVERYLKHLVEQVEVVLFVCALAALGSKVAGWWRERRANGVAMLPAWDGQPQSPAEAPVLLAGLGRLPQGLHDTWLYRRVAAVLDFLARRGSAAELDDQLRDLADADSLALEGSYSLVRLITWAIPILGFLGTVLGITGAIAGVTPERLETDLNSVTDGLALAFDSTALALGLTMVTMFLTFVVERLEQGVLEGVDQYVTAHLAHRFRRAGGEGAGLLAAVEENTKVLVQAMEDLVRRQAAVWAEAQAEADRGRVEAEAGVQARLTAAVEEALERTLEGHARRLAAVEEQGRKDNRAIVDGLAAVAAGLAEQQAALAAQTEVLARLQEVEGQLARNLHAVTAAGSLEQVLHSLTAAVHLLTAQAGRAGAAGAASVVRKPGAAA